MRDVKFQLGLVLLLGIIVGAPLLLLVFGRDKPSIVIPQPQKQAPLLDPPLTSGLDNPRQRKAANIDASVRPYRGIVRSTSGNPLEGAHVIWLALQNEDKSEAPAWPMADWGVPPRRLVESTTDIEGVFEFVEPPPELVHGSILIASHPAHYSGGLDLPESTEWSTSPGITLEPSPTVTVTVVNAAGQPQSGATVHHAASHRPTHERSAIHERFYSKFAVTGLDGRVRLAAFRGEQAFWAEKDDLISVPWQGIRPASIVLELSDSFTIGGTISFLEPLEEERLGERRILVSGLTGNLWRPLARLRDVEEGSWGPVRLPLTGVSRYKVRFEGAPVIPIQETFAPPRASSHQRIDFEGRKGVDLILAVEDESGKAIPTAHGEGWWEPTMLPEVSVSGEALLNGEILLETLPPGWIRFRVAAPGYVTQELDVTIQGNARFPVRLHHGGGISGRCIHDDKPVPDFQIIYWKTGNVQIYRNKSFLGREDGRFDIDGLAAGDWSIQAASPDHPSGHPITVSVTAKQTEDVELQLPTAIRGVGRIIAADTGVPVANARVQPYSSNGLERSLPWGPGSLTDQDGAFDLDAFVMGSNHIAIEAQGFAYAEAEANATNDGQVDWGDIRLFRPQTLQVSLLGVELLPGLQAQDFRAGTEDGYIIPARAFDGDGVVRIAEVPPGDHRLLVYYPDESWGRLQLRLDPGKDWNFDLKVSGDRKLSINVVDSRKGTHAPVSGVYLTAQEETGVFVVRFAWTSQGNASFAGIRATRGQVWLLDTEDNIVTTRDAVFSDSVNAIEISVGEKPFRMRVVDAQRGAVSGAWVTIRSSTGVEIHGADDTGADGWAELGVLPSGSLLMDVQHGVLGRRLGVPIDSSMDELEFVLEATGMLELEMVDGSELLAGVATRIESIAGFAFGDARQTDDQGHVRFEALGEGNYHLACRRSDCWPAFVDEELAPGEHARVKVQMRRLADLDFVLLSADGLPVSGMPVDFRSTEFDLPIDTWVREERVRAPESLTTDGKGSVHVEGLPRGEYTWSLTVDGEALTGSFELAPAQANRVLASLPPAKR